MTPLISIIIPVYNVESFLDSCLQSILNQNYYNWECILVDDGSTDKSGDICEKWADHDSRFFAFHQSNKGVSSARNFGLSVGKGDYLTFVDSDDWLGEEYLYSLVSSINSDTEIDLVVTGITHVFDNGLSKVHVPSEKCRIVIEGEARDTKGYFLNNVSLFYGPQSKLYCYSIIKERHILFPESEALGEDLVFNFRYLSQISSILLIPVSNYYYRHSESGSLMSRLYDNRFPIHYSHWQLQVSFMKKHYLWNCEAEKFYALQLWGIVYEGIICSQDYSVKRLKSILSIPEIYLLNTYYEDFHSAIWIKMLIVNKAALLLYLIRKFRKVLNI